MQEYSMTFIFNKDFSKVLLIEKNRPVEMNGKLNGIGGHKEDYDLTYEDCALREIREESGLILSKEQLINVGHLGAAELGYYVALYMASIEDEVLENYQSLTDETVSLYAIKDIEKRELYKDAKEIIAYIFKNFVTK